MDRAEIQANLDRIIQARHNDPFRVLGRHRVGDHLVVRAYVPSAGEVSLVENNQPMRRVSGTDLFEWEGDANSVPERYRLIWRDVDHRQHIAYDPYSFPPQISDFDLHLFGEGKHWHAYRFLGARPHEAEGIAGVLFAVWAPNAERVSVVGEFNNWDGRRHPMRLRGGSGVWELFIPELAPGALYKYEIRTASNGAVFVKADPYGQRMERRPATASIVAPRSSYTWNDGNWLERRARFDWQHRPMSIFEVHLGSWQRGPEGELLNYRAAANTWIGRP